jgi:hypothetical protein
VFVVGKVEAVRLLGLHWVPAVQSNIMQRDATPRDATRCNLTRRNTTQRKQYDKTHKAPRKHVRTQASTYAIHSACCAMYSKVYIFILVSTIGSASLYASPAPVSPRRSAAQQ